MAERVREGGCGCGAVRFRTRGEPIFSNNCHCRQCQQQTGSTSVVNGFWETENVEILQGELAEHKAISGSGGEHIIVSCAACGSPLWSHYPGMGRLGHGIRAGALDDPGSITPNAVIFTSEKMPWVALPEDIPCFETVYDFREVLPAASLDRLRALGQRRKAGEG